MDVEMKRCIRLRRIGVLENGETYPIGGFIVPATKRSMADIFDDLLDDVPPVGERWEFGVINMTQEELDALPEFMGW